VDEAVTGASLVHLHGLWSSLNRFAARACLRQQVPFVVMPHGMLDPHSLRRKRLKKWLFGHMIEWPLLRRATGMIYTHPEEQRLAESAVRGLPPGHVVSLAADDPPEMDREAMAEGFFDDYPQLRGRKLVIFLSRLHEKKGLDLLIPAFADVARRDPACHLVIVGQGEDRFVDTIHRRVAAANLESRVTFTGPRSGAAKWSALAAGTVMALPSYQENFALVVAEAMAVGLPVVLSGRVNICEDVVRAGAGLECMLQPKSIAESLERFLNDAGFRERAGEAGRTLVRERFTWQRSAAAMEQVYARLLGGTPVAPSNPTPSPFGIP
jgi:glycosyltransferase involved in cell wall biosynthesis